MKRRGVGVSFGAAPKARKWREDPPDDELSVKSDQSLGEELPSEEEAEVTSKPATNPVAENEIEKQTVKPNPVVWMTLKVDDKLLRPMYLELFQDLYPDVTEVFCKLCKTNSASADGRDGYKGSLLHRIVRGSLAQGGDISIKTGDSCHVDVPLAVPRLSHARPGLLSTTMRAGAVDCSEFALSLGHGSTKNVKERNLVIGQVLGGSDEGEAHGLHPLRHVDAVGSPDGVPHADVVIEDCGVCEEDVTPPAMGGCLNQACIAEAEQQRYSRAKFAFRPLQDVVSSGNAEEVMSIVLRDIQWFQRQMQGLDGEAETSMESGTGGAVFHRCEQLEVGLTRVLHILEGVDFKTLDSTRAGCKRLQQQVRALGAKLTRAKSLCRDGETEAYEQRSGL
eukprot:TRINITY_DN49116_c0_g1_i1.p1 TRINITY_DN49116_c0_g1~~TRINITY_DN49116_c0_g1_i1.p1  ORF type:complete len:393 (-),score=69.93 TRINITY_DN49116_c0_g1_i1:536-1714(-)